MNAEKVFNATVATVKDYIKARSSSRKDEQGKMIATGMTFVSPEDKRVEEMCRLIVETVMANDDGKERKLVEAKALQIGDVYTRYTIKDEVGIDEEVTVIKAVTSGNRTKLMFRRHNDSQGEQVLDATYLVPIWRPTANELAAELGIERTVTP